MALTDELKSLVRTGAGIDKISVLSELCDGRDPRAVFQELRELTRGTPYEVLLGFGKWEGTPAPVRHAEVMKRLKVFQSPDTWRREPRERYLMELAEQILDSRDDSAGAEYLSSQQSGFFDENGVLRRVDIVGRIRAVKPMRQSTIRLHYRPDPRPDVYELTPLVGFEIAGQMYNEFTQVLMIQTQFPDLLPGEELTYAYRLTINSDKPTKTTLYYPTDDDQEHARIEVTFHEAKAPSFVWRFQHLHEDTIPGVWSPEGDVRPRRPRQYAAEFRGLRAGLCYGLGWRL